MPTSGGRTPPSTDSDRSDTALWPEASDCSS